MKRILILVILAGIAGYAPTTFAVPQQINYQGYLTQPDGSPMDTTVAMTFTIWNNSGDPLWSEQHFGITVTNGLFSVRLGQTVPIPDFCLTDSDNRQLGIRVGSDSEMTPLIPLSSVPYSRAVGTVNGASGGTISGDVRVTGKGNIGASNSNAGDYAFVAGNFCTASGSHSTVAGGWENTASTNGAAVLGGFSNHADGSVSAIGGGSGNHATGVASCVPGGSANTASGYAAFASGMNNTASGDYSFVAGGCYFDYDGNTAGGENSFAAGHQVIVNGAKSFGLGTNITCAAESAFVWSDGSGPTLSIGSSRTFSVKATNGTRIWSNSDLTAGVRLNAGSSAWIAWSDSTKKRNIRGLDTKDILSRFSSLLLKRWEYKSEDQGVEHIGPMAQDFWNAFHLGDEPLGISTIDADGVMMAAIQELAKRNSELEAQLKELRSQIQTLLARGE